EAQQWGLVEEVVPGAELAGRARSLAEVFASLPPRAVAETKRLLDAAASASLEEQLEAEARTQAELVGTPDFAERVAAFLEKRV
ncbi:MAG: enoyl-CoA hydratase/isomerase family protein, partial [Actinobacteria bacterium]|nr:enoyl-CoA hydratase/isomerase family protein [Actinomycetota bacterium]